MKFSVLAEYLEKLEQTSSRLSLISILSDLFKEIHSPEEIQKVCYLVQGRIAPFYEALEIGMADKTVAESLAKAFGNSKEGVLTLFAHKGDMGKVALELSEHHHAKEPNITVDAVFETLTTIAKTSGEGTVEKKQTLLSDLLQKVDSLSAKHLVRIPLGNLRLGIGDPTVLDALATVKLGDKKQRHYLENAYNRTSDLGLIAYTLWQTKNPVEAVKHVEK